MYAMPGRVYVDEPEKSVYGRGSDGARRPEAAVFA